MPYIYSLLLRRSLSIWVADVRSAAVKDTWSTVAPYHIGNLTAAARKTDSRFPLIFFL